MDKLGKIRGVTDGEEKAIESKLNHPQGGSGRERESQKAWVRHRPALIVLTSNGQRIRIVARFP